MVSPRGKQGGRSGTHTRPPAFLWAVSRAGLGEHGRWAAPGGLGTGSRQGRRALALPVRRPGRGQLWSEVPPRGLLASGWSEPGTWDTQGPLRASWPLPGSLYASLSGRWSPPVPARCPA